MLILIKFPLSQNSLLIVLTCPPKAVETDEIDYLRKQLIIGQSTLDSVLSAEARLYDAEAKEINFIADRRLAELTILSATGLLSDLVGLDR